MNRVLQELNLAPQQVGQSHANLLAAVSGNFDAMGISLGVPVEYRLELTATHRKIALGNRA
jgi:hypothetical protein